MRKIRLELDALRIETFDTGAGTLNRGTVHGRNPTFDCGPYPPPEDSINVCATAAATCNQFTCGYTCGNTCSCGCTRTYEGWTCTCPFTEPETGDINVCP